MAQSVGFHPHTVSQILRECIQIGKAAPAKRGQKTRKYEKERVMEFLANLQGHPNHADATLEETRATISLELPI